MFKSYYFKSEYFASSFISNTVMQALLVTGIADGDTIGGLSFSGGHDPSEAKIRLIRNAALKNLHNVREILRAQFIDILD